MTEPLLHPERDVLDGIVRTPLGVLRECTITEARQAVAWVRVVNEEGRQAIVAVHLKRARP